MDIKNLKQNKVFLYHNRLWKPILIYWWNEDIAYLMPMKLNKKEKLDKLLGRSIHISLSPISLTPATDIMQVLYGD